MSQQVLDRPTDSTADTSPDSGVDYASKFPPLTASDRCDAATVLWKMGKKELTRCGAQAFVRVVLPVSGLDLLFCGHCAGEQTVGKSTDNVKAAYHASQRAALIEQGAVFLSQYDTINLKPTDTSEQRGF